METILTTTVMSILFLAVVISISILIRNNYVFKYRINLNDRGHQVCSNYLHNTPLDKIDWDYHEELEKMWDSLLNNHSYDEMVLKLWKPLKDKYWLTKEQIDFLNLTF